MTPENQKLRDALKAAENIIVSALAHQPESDDKCHEHLLKACRDVGNACCSPLAVGNTAALREALEVIVRDAIAAEEELGSEYGADTDPWGYIADMKDTARLAIAAKPRACDLMSEEALTKGITNGIVSAIESRPELNVVGARVLIEVAVASAISCAYNTQLISTKEGEAK